MGASRRAVLMRAAHAAQTGASFKGVKMVPAGLHFVHIGTGMGEKQGFFFSLEKGAMRLLPSGGCRDTECSQECCRRRRQGADPGVGPSDGGDWGRAR